MAQGGKEIERKYLIEYPDIERLLREGCAVKKIEQTYLISDKDTDRRVRRSVEGERTVCTFTEKRQITKITRYEDEREISEDEYLAYLLNADPEFRTLSKVRYCVRTGDRIAEIDVYDDIRDFAICEVELESEDEAVTLPSCITLIREVTGERDYTNRQFAKKRK